VRLEFDAWREADQRYYVSNTQRFEQATGWSARVTIGEGVRALHAWLRGTRPAQPARTEARAAHRTNAGALGQTVAS
jgi:CDP-paratose 2-epimerase